MSKCNKIGSCTQSNDVECTAQYSDDVDSTPASSSIWLKGQRKKKYNVFLRNDEKNRNREKSFIGMIYYIASTNR